MFLQAIPQRRIPADKPKPQKTQTNAPLLRTPACRLGVVPRCIVPRCGCQLKACNIFGGRGGGVTCDPKPYKIVGYDPLKLRIEPLKNGRFWDPQVRAELCFRVAAAAGDLSTQGAQDLVTPDHRKDLKNRSPNLGPYTTKGTLEELP